jgi:hypothetical protein
MWLAVAVGLICVAVGATVATISLGGGHRNITTSGQKGPLGPPDGTVTHPLLSGAQVSLAQATSIFGSPIVLPSTSAVQPSDLGPIWAVSVKGGATVAVTFPSKGIWISYDRATPDDPASQIDPARHYKDMATAFAGSELVQLNGTTPGIYMPANDGSGTNAVDFEANGAEIHVRGNNDEATLVAIAQSILAQLRSPSS